MPCSKEAQAAALFGALLQSNWNASPRSNFNGTNALTSLPALARQARMKSVTRVYPPIGKPCSVCSQPYESKTIEHSAEVRRIGGQYAGDDLTVLEQSGAEMEPFVSRQPNFNRDVLRDVPVS